MAGEYARAVAHFEKMKDDERKQLDEALSFLTTAQMPTEQGAKNRALMQQNPIDANSLKAIGAYKAYRFKLEHKPMDEKKAAVMRLAKVPDEEIARLNSREKWEADQLGTFDQLAAMVKPHEMAAETINATPPTTHAKPRPHAKPKPEPMELVQARPAPIGDAGAAAMPAPAMAPQSMPSEIAPVMPQDPTLYAAPPQRMPLGAALNGGQLG